MAQRDPLVEYQREGFALFQQMMGQIREETVGFLFNLEVEVTQKQGEVAGVAAKGLSEPVAPVEKLSYSAPSDSGGVEVRDQRGRVQQAATAKASAAAAREARPDDAEDAATTGAFGQQTGGSDETPNNRQERRAQTKRR